MFRDPVLAEDTYSKLYLAGALETWTADGARNDLKLIRAQIVRRKGDQTILDVGCNTGGFLLTLPGSVKKFGVEPSAAAAAQAASTGITIAGHTLEDLDENALFDVITIIDVIEHVTDPMSLLNRASVHLAPGGILIIATGNPLHWVWRHVFRARFWYSSFPEHLSFPSHQALDLWRRERGLLPPTVLQIRYRALAWWMAALHLCGMLVFLISPNLFNAVVRRVERRRTPKQSRRFYTPGGPGVFVDHQVLIFTRPVG